jgi:2-polyprenyl-6-methoxyphenol hydroxylase-like FAD-dependent oxidoreductase
VQNSNNYDIVISGAGPTGLLLANQLARFGINFLIADKKSGPTNESRALALQARSMEIYEQLGVIDEVLRDGEKSLGLGLYKHSKELGSVNLGLMAKDLSPYSFIMVYEQSKNEEMLNRLLQTHGKKVTWNTEIVSYKKNENGYKVIAKNTNGIEESFNCKYLCACDGSKSTIRELSGMPFTGGTYENIFFVADTHVKQNLSHDRLLGFLSKFSINLFFPMQGSHRYRALGILPKEYYHRDDIKFSEIAAHMKNTEKIPFDFYDTSWYSTYRLHHKKVKAFSIGNIFFAGDAAHVHSPAGGQGMNTGLQDAYNLSWKLALVVNKKAKSELLSTYNEERNPIAEDLLKTTDRFFSVMTSRSTFFTFIRMNVAPLLIPLAIRFNYVRRLIFLFASQIRISYNKSSLSKGKAGKVSSGMRLPYFIYKQNGKDTSIYETTRTVYNSNFILLVYGIAAEEFSGLNRDFFTTVSIEKNNFNDTVFEKIGLPEAFVIIVRPDNYILYISENKNISDMTEHFKKYFNL